MADPSGAGQKPQPAHHPEATAGVEVELLGRARVRNEGGWVRLGADHRDRLLVVLACRGDWVRRDELADLLWPEATTEAARTNLRKVVHRARGLAWLAGLEADAAALRWPARTDVAAFEAALGRGELEEALRLEPRLAPGLEIGASEPYAAWLEAERARLHARWRDAALVRAGQLASAGAGDRAVALLERALAYDEFDEAALRDLVRVSAKVGRREVGLRAYRAFEARLADLGLEPSAQTRATLEEGDRAWGFGLDPPPLPVPATSFVGRAREIAEVERLLGRPECRWLTLLGPGGVGKTRLALEVARRAASREAGGGNPVVAFVALGAVTLPEFVPARVCDALGLALAGSEPPLDQLARALGDAEALVVLDNLEHLAPSAPAMAGLLGRCRGLRFLATSRERLGLEPEWLAPLEGLTAVAERARNGAAAGFEAQALFLERAGRVRPGFALDGLDERSLAALEEIVSATGGVPLALELCAAWMRAMPLSAIARELRSGAGFLQSPHRDAPERHRSLRATFEHSWALLDEAQRAVLRRLAVIRGPFPTDDARHIGGASLASLADLVDRSMLKHTADGFAFHPLVAEFCLEHLRRRPAEWLEVHRAHAGLYLERLRRTLDAGQVRPFLENAVAAWLWSLEHDLEPGGLGGLEEHAAALEGYFTASGQLEDGVALFEEGVAVLGNESGANGRAVGVLRAHQAWLLTWFDRYPAATRAARDALSRLDPSLDPRGIIAARRALGQIARRAGRQAEAHDHFLAALGVAEARGLEVETAVLLDAVGMVEMLRGQYETARERIGRALAINERLQATHPGAAQQIVYNLFNLGQTHLDTFEPGRALPYSERALEQARAVGYRLYEPYCLTHLALAHEMLGRFAQGLDLGLAAVERARPLREPSALAYCLVNLARNRLGLRDPAERGLAALELAEAARLTRDSRAALIGLTVIPTAALLLAERGEVALALAWLGALERPDPASGVETQRWLLEDARRLRARWLAEGRLSAEVLEAAASLARERSFEDVLLEVAALEPLAPER